MLTAIESGYVQQEIQDAAYEFQKSLERGESVTVGVNRFVDIEDAPVQLLRVDPRLEAAQCQRLSEMRSKRDNERVSALRLRLEESARTDENLMPLFITCVENDVTLGEICQTLRHCWGEYKSSVKL